MLRWSVAGFVLLSVAALLAEAPQQGGGGGDRGRREEPSSSPPASALAQGLSAEQAEDQAQRLVVMIDGKFGDESSIGAGIIFDKGPDSLYIVTANHVVRRGTPEAGDIHVRLVMLPGERLPAKLLDPFTDQDLAVLKVEGVSAFQRELASLRLDRLGDLDAVKVRDEVYTIGQPNGKRWDVSAGGDRITRVEAVGFAFQSSGVAPGSSGGALFNAQRLLIGLVQKDVPPSAEAIRIDVVMRVLRAEKYSVAWRRPTADSGTLAGGNGRSSGVSPPPPSATPGGSRPDPLMVPAISLRIFSQVSAAAAHPSATVEVPDGWKIISGGASVDWRGAGNLLTASYPANARTWIAASKDHGIADPATVTAFAVALNDPHDEWDVAIVSAAGAVDAHPTAVASLPPNYTIVGGGARIQWSGGGNLLTASFPRDRRSWEARGKDHGESSPAAITAYAIGIRARNGLAFPETRIVTVRSNIAAHPEAAMTVPPGFRLLGGGAVVNWTGAGSLLTASFPSSDLLRWTARAKDHGVSDPSSVNVFVIAFNGAAP
jgi:hypothetical protein